MCSDFSSPTTTVRRENGRVSCQHRSASLKEWPHRLRLNANALSRTDGAMSHTLSSAAAAAATTAAHNISQNAGYPRDKCTVFEVDRRFECYGSQFVFYGACASLSSAPAASLTLFSPDLNHPQSVPKDQLHSFDFVCIDPPFLNRDTVQAMLQTAALLARTSSTPMLILTGATLEQDILDVSNGALQRQEFVPRHEGSRLRNDFASFANFPLQQL